MSAWRLIVRVAAGLCVVVGVLALASAPAFALVAHSFSSAFGSAGGGAGEIALTANSEVAVNQTTHDLYVADTDNARIDEFTSTGAFLRAWGWGVADGLPAFETCTLVCQAGLPGSGAGQLATPTFIAVDNSGGASTGDVYVGDTTTNIVSKFSASGSFISSNDGSGASTPIAGPFRELGGVAVDGSGDSWVYDTEGNMYEFAPGGSFATDWNSGRGVTAAGIAIDSSGNLDVATGAIGVSRFTASGSQIGDIDDSYSTVTGIGIDPSTDDLYVDDGGAIRHYAASCDPAEGECRPVDTFGGAQLSAGAAGLALDSSSHDLYALDTSNARLDVFQPVLLPDVSTDEASQVKPGTATLNGAVNPDGLPITSCRFEYGTTTAYGASTQCTSDPGSGSAEVSVSASLSGLPVGEYHYRLVAGNANGENAGADTTFKELAPAIEDQSISNAESTGATVQARLDAEGAPTTYEVEYGTTSSYGTRTSEVSIGAPEEAVSVLVKLNGLQPGTEYHARIVTTNEFGTTQGLDMTFATVGSVGATASTLPDDRVYELVSTPESPGEVYVPSAQIIPTEDFDTSHPAFEASSDGEAVVYVGDPSASGGTGNTGPAEGDEHLAARRPGGWAAEDIAPTGVNPAQGDGYQAFSEDFSVGIVRAQNRPPIKPPLTSDTPECRGYILYARENHAGAGSNPYSPLFTKADSAGECGDPLFAGESVGGSHRIFQDEFALATGAEDKASGRGPSCTEHCNLYDFSDGQLWVVDVLPDGKVDSNATFGGPSGGGRYPNFRNAISKDGSRILWTDLSTSLLYLREADTSPAARTIQISAGPATFWTASPDGHYVFYTEGESLMRFDVERFDTSGKAEPEALAEAREAIVGEGAGVQGVLGVNETGEDGAYIYFVAEGALAPQSERRSCKTAQEELGEEIEKRAEEGEALSQEESERFDDEQREEDRGSLPTARGCNLYVLHVGEPVRSIGVLGKSDNEQLGSGNAAVGDWLVDPKARTAEVSPDGRQLVFESNYSRSLAGYDNSYMQQGGPKLETEVFTYDADTGQVACASCDPSGAAPRDRGNETVNGTFLPLNGNVLHKPRWIAEGGNYVFFDTDRPLVPQDTNGLQDVYEWEREGAPSCPVRSPARRDRGCLFVLSGGTSSDWSWLIDASVSGRDVFLASRAHLVPADRSEKMQLYDVRVDGGFPEVEHACTGAGCQGVPPTPPIFATPSSVTFEGVGNFAPPSKTAVKPKRKATKCKKGFVEKRGRCVKKAKSKAKRGASKTKKHGKRTVRRKK